MLHAAQGEIDIGVSIFAGHPNPVDKSQSGQHGFYTSIDSKSDFPIHPGRLLQPTR
jgi:hypothetical protein